MRLDMAAMAAQGAAAPRSAGAAGLGQNQDLMHVLIREVQNGKHATKIFKFPAEEVSRHYWEWKCSFDNFLTTNPHLDAQSIMQMLKEACLGTKAEPIVTQFSTGQQHYSIVIDALDRRFFIPRVILSEFLEPILHLSPPVGGNRLHLEEYYRSIIDHHQALAQNISIVCKLSLRAKGIPAPTQDQLNAEMTNAVFVALLQRNLNDALRNHLATTLATRQLELPAYNDVLWAVERKYIATQGNTAATAQSSTATSRSHTSNASTRRLNAQVSAPAKPKVEKKPVKPRFCLICSGSHDTSWCPKLKEKTTWDEKIEVLKSNKANMNICYVCLDGAFGTCQCRAEKRTCSNCGGRHHKALCQKPAQPASKGKGKGAILKK